MTGDAIVARHPEQFRDVYVAQHRHPQIDVART
jgi:hypothetical protein